jgi:glycosyltransferase involved in cell wall biosynthesis
VRVLHVMESTIGGTRRHIVDVARGQQRGGIDVHLCVADLRDEGFRADLGALESEGIDVRRLPMVRAIRPATDWRHIGMLAGLLRELHPDIVHTHSSKAGVLGRLASLCTELGHRVHTPHTFAFLFRDMFGPLQRGLFREVEAALSSATQRVIAVSRSEAETFARSGVVPEERIRVVENGLDPSPWRDARPAERDALGLPRDAVVGAIVGLLNVAKGQDLAVRALVRPELSNVHWLLVGHGELEEPLRSLARELGVSSRVHLLGWRDDVPSLMKLADFLALPSRWEGMPYVLLEAMAAGKPVVAAAVDGARDLVCEGESGFLCSVGDEADFGRAVARVVAAGSEGRARLGASGARLLGERHSLSAMIEGLTRVYEELL